MLRARHSLGEHKELYLPYPSVPAFTWAQNRWMQSQFSSDVLGSVASSYGGRKTREEEGKPSPGVSERSEQEQLSLAAAPELFVAERGDPGRAGNSCY